MLLNCLYIADTKNKGRGVFTDKFIEAGTLIEVAPVIVLNEADTEKVHETALYYYTFMWSENNKIAAVVLGYGSIYNHSYSPNCEYKTFYEDEVVHFVALRDIEAGEELTINYNHDPNDQSLLWFKTRD